MNYISTLKKIVTQCLRLYLLIHTIDEKMGARKDWGENGLKRCPSDTGEFLSWNSRSQALSGFACWSCEVEILEDTLLQTQRPRAAS